jgi:iron only hydrogenase large subunit-like protein
MVVQTAPAVRVAIGEEVGLAPGSIETGQMVAGEEDDACCCRW